jgi:hypothetical protein
MNHVSKNTALAKVWVTKVKQTQERNSQSQSAQVTRLNPWSLSTTSLEMLATRWDLRALLSIVLSFYPSRKAAAIFNYIVEKCIWH